MARPKTGFQLLRNPTLMQSITDALAAGQPITKIAAQHHTCVETIKAALAKSEDVQSFERQTAAKLERIMAKQLEKFEKALDGDKVNPNSTPVHFGIFADKRASMLNDTQSKPDESGQSVQSILDDLKGIQVNVQVNVTQPVETKQVSIDIERPKV